MGGVCPPWAADRDERQPVGTGYRATRGVGVDADERALADRHLFAVDSPVPAPGDDDRHLFLVGAGLVVLDPLAVRGQVETVDPERLDAERAADEADRAAGPARLDVVDVDEGVAHGERKPTCSRSHVVRSAIIPGEPRSGRGPMAQVTEGSGDGKRGLRGGSLSMAANINPQGTVGLVGRAVPLAFVFATVGVLLVSYTFVRLCQVYNHAGSVFGFVGATLG